MVKKYNRILRDKDLIFAYMYFQYNGEIKNIPSRYFDKISKSECEESFNKIKDKKLKDYINISNIEDRRILLSEYLATESGKQEILNVSTLLSEETLDKKTWWYDKTAEKEVTYKDTYTLYLVDLNKLFGGNNVGESAYGYLLVFKDTSTTRHYMLWVDMRDILITNHDEKVVTNYDAIFKINQYSEEGLKQRLLTFLKKHVGAVDAIAWTITTAVPKDKIRGIIRQGDCILVDADIESRKELVHSYHLSREIYLKYMYKES